MQRRIQLFTKSVLILALYGFGLGAMAATDPSPPLSGTGPSAPSGQQEQQNSTSDPEKPKKCGCEKKS